MQEHPTKLPGTETQESQGRHLRGGSLRVNHNHPRLNRSRVKGSRCMLVYVRVNRGTAPSAVPLTLADEPQALLSAYTIASAIFFLPAVQLGRYGAMLPHLPRRLSSCDP